MTEYGVIGLKQKIIKEFEWRTSFSIVYPVHNLGFTVATDILQIPITDLAHARFYHIILIFLNVRTPVAKNKGLKYVEHLHAR